MAETFEALKKRREFIIRLVWLALALALGGYAWVLKAVIGSPSFQLSDDVILIMVVCFAVASWQVRRQLLSERRLQLHLAKPINDPFTVSLTDSQRRLLTVPLWMSTPLMISWALNEVIAITGILSQDWQRGLTLIGIAAVLHILSYPRFEEYYAMAERLMPQPS